MVVDKMQTIVYSMGCQILLRLNSVRKEIKLFHLTWLTMVSSDVVMNYMKFEVVLLCMVKIMEKRHDFKNFVYRNNRDSTTCPFPSGIGPKPS